MSAAAVIAIRRKKLIASFRNAGAIDPAHAVTLEALGQRPTWIFDRMTRRGVFVPLRDSRFYLNEQVATEFLRQQRQRALSLGIILVVIFVLLWMLGLFGR